jgi:carbamoyltransferase
MERIIFPTADGMFKLDPKYFVFNSAFTYESQTESPAVPRMFSPAMEELLGPARQPDEPLDQRHKDLARSAQVLYENLFFEMLNKNRPANGSKNITMSGGCAYNSVANGKITLRTPFENVYVQAAAGDSGGALGAAYVIWHRINPGRRGPRMEHAYWGPAFKDAELRAAIEQEFVAGKPAGIEVRYSVEEDSLARETAQAVADGNVVGWFQGATEWGPRALGNRSIVCDPRRANMKDILNQKIKRRESFRPFAPSILRESVPEWFETDGDVPFMMQVYQVRSDKRSVIPAVTHVDGSGRLQTVTPELNPSYYKLITEFRRITQVPCVLNTSFNENEPIVCHPKQALDCFLRTRMDVLVLGSHIVRRSNSN